MIKYGNTEHVADLRRDIEDFIDRFLRSNEENFCCLYAGRDVGKTYTAEKCAVKRLDEIGGHAVTVYPRKGQIDEGVLESHWKKMLSREFKDRKATYDKTKITCRKKGEKTDKILATACWLGASEEDKVKTMPDCQIVIVDETTKTDLSPRVAEKAIYNLFTLYETTDRQEDRVKVVMMGNILNPADPVFALFGIKPGDLKDENEGMITKSVNTIAWHVPRPPDVDIKEDGTQSRFSQMIARTDYGKISRGEFRADYGAIIQKPDPQSKIVTCFAVMLEPACYMIVAQLNDGLTYLESVNADVFAEIPRRYTLSYVYATTTTPMLPASAREFLQRTAGAGRLKFVDIENAVILGNKIDAKLHLRLI